MSEFKSEQNEYTEGVMSDGACILKNRSPMKIGEILKEFNSKASLVEYKDHEFCKRINCNAYIKKHEGGPFPVCVLKGHPSPDCNKTANEFQKWLKENGYRIVKDGE